MATLYYESSFAHHGIKGQKWGVRRFQNYDGTRIKSGSVSLKDKVASIEYGPYRYDGTHDTATKTLPYAVEMYDSALKSKKIKQEDGKKLKILIESTSDDLSKLGKIGKDLAKDNLGYWIRNDDAHNRHYMEMSKHAEIDSLMDDGKYPTTGNIKSDMAEAARVAKEYTKKNFDSKNSEMHRRYDEIKVKYQTNDPIALTESLADSISVNDRKIFNELNRLHINEKGYKQSYYNSGKR